MVTEKHSILFRSLTTAAISTIGGAITYEVLMRGQKDSVTEKKKQNISLLASFISSAFIFIVIEKIR